MTNKPITIITTIYPDNGKGARKITVAAAAEGDLPAFLPGAFSDRHQLADQAYGDVLKRLAADSARAAKKAAAKPRPGKKKPGKAKRKSARAAAEQDEAPGNGEARNLGLIEEADQIGPAERPGTDGEAPAGLPVIEGDDEPGAGAAQMELEMEGEDD